MNIDTTTSTNRTSRKRIRNVLRRWVSAYVASYEKYYLGFGQGG
jgi:hypothetical protein